MRDRILSKVKWQFAIVCLEDVFIFSRSAEKRLDQPRTVIGLLSKAGESLKRNKCYLLEDRIEYLRHIVQPYRLGISTKATNSFHRLQHTTVVTELKSFLALCNVLRRFVASFARIAAALNFRLKKTSALYFGRLNKTEIEALESLQHRLLPPLILLLPRTSRRYTLLTDAFDKQV